MKNHRQVDRLISEAKAGRRCIHSTVKSEVAALRRRATDNGELVRVIPGFYAPREYWHGLPPPERTLHLARAVGKEHPQWVFAGTVAAAAHGLEQLHKRTKIKTYKRKDFLQATSLILQFYCI